MAKYNGNRALGILAENWDSGDSWGSTLMALGGVCDFLAVLEEWDRIPADAGYRPGAGLLTEEELREATETWDDEESEWNGRISDDMVSIAMGYWNIGMVDDWEPFTLDDVESAAIILTRWANVLKSMGKDY